MGGPRAWVGLGVLFLVYTLNFLDRSLIYILFKPIKAEMELSGLQLALLGSTAFVIFYTLLGIPFGRLADRAPRIRMIAAGLAVWSIASAATGFAGGFVTLFLCRMMVGVGEATLGPAAYSLLADWFPPERRGTAAAVFSAGIPIGGGLAMALGGWIAQEWGWRAAFPILGVPGVLLAVVVLLLPEPDRTAPKKDVAASGERWFVVLWRNTSLRWHVGGYALLNVAASSLSMWVPTLLSDRFDKSLAEVGAMVGLAAAGGGLVGTLFGGVAADAFQRRFAGGRMIFTATCAAAFALVWAGVLWVDTWQAATVVMFVGMALGLCWLGPASADVQDLADAPVRGTAIAGYYFVVNGVGYGIAPPIVGWLRDQSTLDAALIACPVAAVGAAALLALGARSRAARTA